MVETFYRIMTRGAKGKRNQSSGTNKVEITVTPSLLTNEKPYQCQNRRVLLNHSHSICRPSFANINETHCFHNGDKHCRYIIEWRKTPSLMLKSFRNYLLLGVALSGPIFSFSSYPSSMDKSYLESHISTLLLHFFPI